MKKIKIAAITLFALSYVAGIYFGYVVYRQVAFLTPYVAAHQEVLVKIVQLINSSQPAPQK